ncbi:uncharacterized protein LOC116691966 isoform X2 [Etheostoma spectabile]|uniref:uncharacterized protein LOC116691966 isoform X2 n=1 Tax=Etheostoma spectabile TaxID=54343 RepID=UPI0013AE884B|nr:uncharacterized protein LOC116691966 isoform X2 [Etheostoma spectabile]
MCVQGIAARKGLSVTHNAPTGSYANHSPSLQLPDCDHSCYHFIPTTSNIKMRTLCLIMLFHASLQLECNKRDITAHIGGEFILICKYDATRFLFSRKYWCRGDSRRTCEILVDSERKTENTHRAHIIDAGKRGLIVKVTDLQLDNAGLYWVGIDKMYSDIMTSVNVVITEVPVSEPSLQPLGSLVDRQTCWGQPVTVRCGCAKGTGVRYAWYTHYKDFLLHRSSDLYLHCGTVETDNDYYCIASNDISSQRSGTLSVHVLLPADNSCIYVIHMQGQPIYDCDDRMSTSTVMTTCQAPVKIRSDTGNRSLLVNQTDQDMFFNREWTGVPLWYTLLRWGSFASLLIFLCAVLKRAKKKRRVHVRRTPQLVY